MKNTKVKIIIDTAVGSGLTCLLMVISLYVPVLALFSAVLGGMPMIYLGTKYHTGVAAAAGGLGVLFLILLTGNPVSALLMGISALLPGWVIGYAISQRTMFKTTVFAAAGAVMFGLLIQLILLNASGNGSGIENTINTALNQAKETMQGLSENLTETGRTNMAVFSVFDIMTDQIKEIIFLYLPSFVIGASVVIGYLTVMAGIYVLHRFRICRIFYPPLSKFHASRAMCWTAMVLFLVASFSHDSTVYTAALKNMVSLLYAFLGVCGFSLIDDKFSKRLPVGFLRAVVYFAAFFVSYLMIGFIIQILTLIGLIDGMLNFRRLGKVGEDHVKHN